MKKANEEGETERQKRKRLGMKEETEERKGNRKKGSKRE